MSDNGALRRRIHSHLTTIYFQGPPSLLFYIGSCFGSGFGGCGVKGVEK